MALVSLLASLPGAGLAQSEPPAEEPTSDVEREPESIAPAKVNVDPAAEDREIADRLERILEATSWFRRPQVEVREGVAFLKGETSNDDRKAWAQKLASGTQDVVAVVNQIEVDRPSLLNFDPALTHLNDMLRGFVQGAPTALVALLLVVAAWFAAGLAGRVAGRVVERRVDNALLRGVVAKAAAIPVLVIGIYIALRVTGLTRLAATVLGGTGLLGIVIGIAFRDIAENFLASILISLQRPFQAGDLVTIDGRKGFVQSVTTRGTQIMTLDGNHVQIPNSIVYKSVIENESANPNLRLNFVVGIDYADAAAGAQDTIYGALRAQEAVLDEPEPLVLVEELASSTVNLRVYFWIDGSRYSPLKVRSAVMRKVKLCLDQQGFTLPDESREMIFPRGVPVTMQRRGGGDDPTPAAGEPARAKSAKEHADGPAAKNEPDIAATQAEGGLRSERHEIEHQAATSRPLAAGEDLLPKDE